MKKLFLFTTFIVVLFCFLGVNTPNVKAATIEELQTKIQSLLAQIAQLQKELSQMQGQPVTWCYDFNLNLKFGMAGTQIRALQTVLQKEGLYERTITGTFDEYTASVVVGFQEKYKSEILTPLGLKNGTGFVGNSTRAKLNTFYGCGAVAPKPVSVAVPYISYISPSQGPQDTDLLRATIKGYNFTGAGEFSGCGISPVSDRGFQLISCKVISDTEIEAQFSITDTAVLGGRYITVATPRGGKSNSIIFTITSLVKPSVQASIKVISPNGGEILAGGQTYTITWQSSEVSRIKIALCAETPLLPTKYTCHELSGISDVGISATLGKFSWYVDPNDPFLPGQVKIKIWDVSNSSIYDESNGYFSINQSLTCVRETAKAGVTCGGYFYEDYCENFSDGTGYANRRKCNASTGNDCSSLVNIDRTYCPYGCQSGVCKPKPITPSITINSNPQADSNGNVTIKQGDWITITGISLNLSGQMIVDYTRVFFFDSIFNNACSHTDWVMTCTANQIGTSNFYIRLYKDGQTYQSNIIKVTVIAPTPSITVTSPNGGERWEIGDIHDITWKSSGVYTVMIEIEKGYSGWHLAYNVPAYLEKFSWKVEGVAPGDGYKVNIWDSDNSNISDSSDNFFTILEDALGLRNLENQLASISDAIFQLSKKIKDFLNR